MQLYVVNNRGEKVYLDVTAPTRAGLAYKIGFHFQADGQRYSVNQVFAEPSSNDASAGAVLGGLLGLLGGGVGLLIGGVAGGLIGNIRDDEERKLIKKFNNSLG